MNKEEIYRLQILEEQEELNQDFEWHELDREIIEAIEEATEDNWIKAFK